MEILKVNDLKTYFNSTQGIVRAVDGISFVLHRRETLGIIGESGAGKSVTALSVMGLARQLGAAFSAGQVWYHGQNLLEKPALYKEVRGRKLSLIPQEAGSALNPVITVEGHLGELLRVHLGLSGRELKSRIIQLLTMVELPEPHITAQLYSHQLSGGTLQRVLLAMAISCEPDIIIADEPASALDVTVQAEVLRLLEDVKINKGLSMVLISHDLALISRHCNQILVMYRGRLMESGPAAELLKQPLHPYTANLVSVYRSYDKTFNPVGYAIGPGNAEPAAACCYFSRCQKSSPKCITISPEPRAVSGNRIIACHYFAEQTEEPYEK